MKRLLILSGLWVLPTLLLASGVPNSITYQGTLKNNGVPVNEPHDLTFQLTDNTGNITYSDVIPFKDYPIHQGLFSVDLSFVKDNGATPIPWQSITPYILVTLDTKPLGKPEPLNSTAYSLMSASVMDGAITKAKLDLSTQGLLIPVGTILAFAGKNAPSGWLLCDGKSYDANQYQDLAKAIGGTWGGDGVTSFKVPDLMGRTLIGAGQGTGLTRWDVGQSTGEEKHKLSVDEIPQNLTVTDPGHFHSVASMNQDGFKSAVPPRDPFAHGMASTKGDNNESYIYRDTDGQNGKQLIGTAFTGIEVGGKGNAYTNIQPSAVVNYIIKI